MNTGHQRDQFVEHYKQKFDELNRSIQNEVDFFQKGRHREAVYRLVKQLRNASAVYQQKEIYHKADFLLRCFHTKDGTYKVDASLIEPLFDGLHTIGQMLSGNHKSEVETKAPAKARKSISKVLIADKRMDITTDFLETDWDQEGVHIVHVEPESLLRTVYNELVLERNIAIIVNMSLPDRQGFSLIRQIQENHWAKSIPIIAVAEESEEERLLEILSLKVDSLLVKPFTTAYLKASLDNTFYRMDRSAHVTYEQERKELTKHLQKEWLRFVRFQSYFSLVFVLLDEFPYLLSRYGSESVFQFFSALYESSFKVIRNYDEVKRWNMNSFVLLLPMARESGAALVAERIQRLMAQAEGSSDFASFVRIGVIESEHGYLQAEDMVIRVEKELAFVASHQEIYKASAANQTTAIQEGKRIKVFIVDDDLVAPTILKNHLNVEEWDVEICVDTGRALEQAIHFQPDIVISETKMEGMNGFALCLQIRQVFSSKQTAFIFLSEQSTESNVLRGLQVGADDFIDKPFAAAEVESRMRRQWTLRQEMSV